jgi:hypothetical protein
VTDPGPAVLAPSYRHARSRWFNLRAIRDHSPTTLLAETPADKAGVRAFLRGYGVEAALDHQIDPKVRLQAYLAQSAAGVPSRFSDGSFRVVYLGDDERTCLAEVSHHLAHTLAETEAEKARTHYFILARFQLQGVTLDVRRGFPGLHRRDDRATAQGFGGRAWAQGALGILYKSVRRARAASVAVFRPALVKAGTPMHLVALRWEEGRLVQV